jgi:hypothetical protein
MGVRPVVRRCQQELGELRNVDLPPLVITPGAREKPMAAGCVGHGTELGAITGADGLGIGASAGGLIVRAGVDGLIVGTTGGGLRPPEPSSVEPNGIPARPPDDTGPIAVGDEADAAGPAKELPLAPQPLDAVPLVPPPSNSEVEPDMPVAELALVLPVLHGAPPSIGDTPDVVGLRPGDASSIAPRGTPVGPTAVPGPMPRGDVMPSGDVVSGADPSTCAMAAPQLKPAAARAAAIKRIIIVRSHLTL